MVLLKDLISYATRIWWFGGWGEIVHQLSSGIPLTANLKNLAGEGDYSGFYLPSSDRQD